MKPVRSLVKTDSKPEAKSSAAGPKTRLRRNRAHDWTRRLTCENAVSVNDLILPIFVLEGSKTEEPVKSMPGVSRYSIDLLLKEIEKAAKFSIPAIALFPVISGDKKSADGREAWAESNLVSRTVRAIKKEIPDIGIICDVALDPYTSHGHDGLVNESGYVVNDETVEVLCKQALSQAEAGVDIVAPSDMMDGRVGAIRDALDAAGFVQTSILSYAAKFASAYYGPFREAAHSAPGQGDRRGYQADCRNGRDAVRDALLDEAEGADMLMVKPALAYLDVIAALRLASRLPIACYNVSGEYSMVKAAAAAGLIDEGAIVRENLLAMRRAGADLLITYHGREALTRGWLK